MHYTYAVRPGCDGENGARSEIMKTSTLKRITLDALLSDTRTSRAKGTNTESSTTFKTQSHAVINAKGSQTTPKKKLQINDW